MYSHWLLVTSSSLYIKITLLTYHWLGSCSSPRPSSSFDFTVILWLWILKHCTVIGPQILGLRLELELVNLQKTPSPLLYWELTTCWTYKVIQTHRHIPLYPQERISTVRIFQAKNWRPKKLSNLLKVTRMSQNQFSRCVWFLNSYTHSYFTAFSLPSPPSCLHFSLSWVPVQVCTKSMEIERKGLLLEIRIKGKSVKERMGTKEKGKSELGKLGKELTWEMKELSGKW